MAQDQNTKPLPESKRCPRCGETKTAAEFYVTRVKGNRWLSAYCKPCHIAHAALWGRENRERRNSLSVASYHRVKARKNADATD